MKILGAAPGSEGHAGRIRPRMCYSHGTNRMEKHEEASEGVSEQVIAVLPTETDYSAVQSSYYLQPPSTTWSQKINPLVGKPELRD